MRLCPNLAEHVGPSRSGRVAIAGVLLAFAGTVSMSTAPALAQVSGSSKPAASAPTPPAAPAAAAPTAPAPPGGDEPAGPATAPDAASSTSGTSTTSEAAATSTETSAEAASAEATAAPAAATAPAVTSADAAAALPPASIPTPGELGDRWLGDFTPEAATKTGWTAPAPVLTLHGYMRVRGSLMDSFWLGRAPHDAVFAKDNGMSAYEGLTREGLGPDPFSRFRPIERSKAGLSCAGESSVSEGYYLGGNVCDVDTLQFADMRLRLEPQLNLSEDVRVKSTFDILDNYVLGNAPASYYGTGGTAGSAFAATNVPAGSTIVARRAWAEVRNRDLGELRFGLMPQHWGLGMLYDAGDGLDDDYSTDLGRVMGITKIAGFYLTASYDFIAEGLTGNKAGEYRPDFDGSQIDDVDQFSVSVARRMPDEDEQTVIDRGDVVANGGLHFTIRNQDATLRAKTGADARKDPQFDAIEATYYTPDLWGQLRYRGLRLELESAVVLGSVRDVATNQQYDIGEFGAVLESELRLVDDHLGLYLYTGLATGDSDVEGLSSDADFITQLGTNETVSTFRFHPSYRVDTILWRNIMRQVTGAYYFKPGISYDFVRDDFGQLFGARLDFIWSRAAAFLQTPGNDEDLGIELNAQIYWRSDDGPAVDDGYHASLQYGVLFPMRGLGYYHRDVSLDTAQSLRLLLGVAF
jgi:uncharacterized protein (TIGR04551 family)